MHRGEQAQRDRILIQARAGFVRARTQLVNQVRGFAKALGTRVPSSSTEAFPTRVRATTPMDLFPGLETLLETIEQLTVTIRQMDREVERLCRERYPETELLRQVPGVGAITALYYVLTIEDPRRFAKSRSVGAYVGLRPRQRSWYHSESALRGWWRSHPQAISIDRPRTQRLPARLMPSSCSESPLWWGVGASPAKAPTSLPLRNCRQEKNSSP